MTGSASDPADEFRWAGFFQRSTDALFVLNRRRQLLFVNRAWEALTGLTKSAVFHRTCKRQRDADPGSSEAVLSAMSPPRKVLEGKQTAERRHLPRSAGPAISWDVEFLPLTGDDGIIGVLGVIRPVHSPSPPTPPPLPEKLVALRQRATASLGLDRLRSKVPGVRRIAEQVRLASQMRMPVLLVGERGVGKEWLARTIHAESPAREKPLFAIDCLHLPAAAVAWALFGPQALARRVHATLYLHEAARLPRELQARFVELFGGATGEAGGPRLIAGSSEDLEKVVQTGLLLEEFHCLVSPLTIRVPALRDRLADLPGLVERFLERASVGRDTPVVGLTNAAWELVRAFAWPGNLDELYAVLAGACGRAAGDRVDESDLPVFLRPVPVTADRTWPLDKILEQVERRLLELALVSAKGNKSKAADLLEIWRPRLLRRLEALGMEE
jgi:PAS domain S-box-containing protein